MITLERLCDITEYGTKIAVVISDFTTASFSANSAPDFSLFLDEKNTQWFGEITKKLEVGAISVIGSGLLVYCSIIEED